MSADGKDRLASWAPGEVLFQPDRQPLKCFGPPLKVWVADHELTRVVVHHYQCRTRACTLRLLQGDCGLCLLGFRRLKQAWLQVCEAPHASSPPKLLMLTELAVEDDWRFAATGCDLWAFGLTVWREPSRPNGRMHARVDADDVAVSMPKVEPTLEILHRMFRAANRAENDALRSEGSP